MNIYLRYNKDLLNNIENRSNDELVLQNKEYWAGIETKLVLPKYAAFAIPVF